MVIFGIVIGVVVVVVGVAMAYDLRARRHRALSEDFRESGRLSSRRAAHDRKAAAARNRPTTIGGSPGGPSLGP